MKKRYEGRTAKKSEGIRKEAILAKGKLEPKYLTIQYYKQKKDWDILWMCQQLNVSRAGYYKWIHREKTSVELENEQITLWIKEYDQKFKHTLGYRRMRNYINRDKESITANVEFSKLCVYWESNL